MLAVREPRFQDREPVPPSGASHAKPSLLLSGLARDWLLRWAPPSRGPKLVPLQGSASPAARSGGAFRAVVPVGRVRGVPGGGR